MTEPELHDIIEILKRQIDLLAAENMRLADELARVRALPLPLPMPTLPVPMPIYPQPYLPPYPQPWSPLDNPYRVTCTWAASGRMQ